MLALKEKISQLDRATDRSKAVDECLAGIERLNHEVKDAASYIPAYDRRSYADVSMLAYLGAHMFWFGGGMGWDEKLHVKPV